MAARLERKWPALRFGEVTVATRGEQHVFEVQVYLDDLDPNAVQVDIYADGIGGGSPERREMAQGAPAGRIERRLRV